MCGIVSVNGIIYLCDNFNSQQYPSVFLYLLLLICLEKHALVMKENSMGENDFFKNIFTLQLSFIWEALSDVN